MHKYTKKYKERQREVLRNIYNLNGATIYELKSLFYPNLSKSRIKVLLSELVSLMLIKKETFSDLKGRTSQVIYYLRPKGGRQIGINKLSSRHRRGRSLIYYTYSHAKKVTRILAERYNMILYDNPVLARYAIAKWIARQEGKRHKPEHYYLYIPKKPNTVLVTKEGIIIFILAHPESGLLFWKAVRRKYFDLLTLEASRNIQFALICLDDEKPKEKRQQAEATEVFANLSVSEKEHLAKKLGVIRESEDKTLLNFDEMYRITFIESYEIPKFFARLDKEQNIVHRKGRHISRR